MALVKKKADNRDNIFTCLLLWEHNKKKKRGDAPRFFSENTFDWLFIC